MAIEIPSFDPNNLDESADKIFTSLVEEQQIPVEPSVTITMTLITEIYPNISNEDIGQVWRYLHKTYLMPGIMARTVKKRPQ